MLRAQANTNASEHSTQSKYRNIIFAIGANLLLLKDRGSIHTNQFLNLYFRTLEEKQHWTFILCRNALKSIAVPAISIFD